jgi:hypothetical protein
MGILMELLDNDEDWLQTACDHDAEGNTVLARTFLRSVQTER